jgi:hypothetical protein
VVWTAVIAAVALVAVLVAVRVGDDDGADDGTGRYDVSLDDPSDVHTYEVTLQRGDVLEVRVDPAGPLDVAFAYGLDEATATADFRQFNATDEELGAYLERLREANALFRDTPATEDLYVLYALDREGPGVEEHDVLLAGADGVYRVLVRSQSAGGGDAVVDLQRARRQELLVDRARYEQVMEGSRLSFEGYQVLFG